MASRLPDYDRLLRISARGAWDPAAIDLSLDLEAWGRAPRAVRARVRGLVAGFVVGEEAVALHLPPIGRGAPDGLRACLRAQAVEEERHADAARRAWAVFGAEDGPGGRPGHDGGGLDHVLPDAPGGRRDITGADPADVAPPALVALFRERLPAVVARAGERTTEAIALYHGLLEGVVFLAGQRTVRALAAAHGLEALDRLFARIERDERWHVALGMRVLFDSADGGRLAARLPGDAAEAADAWGPLVDRGIRDDVVAAVARRLRAAGLVVAA